MSSMKTSLISMNLSDHHSEADSGAPVTDNNSNQDPESEGADSAGSKVVGVEKDSRQAWIVCLCGFVSQVTFQGILHAFGVFFLAFVKEFDSSKASTAWIGSVAYGLSMAFAPIGGFLINKFGHRSVMIVGGCFCTIALVISSFCTKMTQLFAAFSVLYGAGTCMAITPTMTVGQDYFDKYKSVAVGMITAGSSTGTLIFAPLSQTLVETVGWRNTFRSYAGLCVLAILCGLMIKPKQKELTKIQKLKQSPLKGLMQDLKLWKNRVFVVWTMAVTSAMFGYYVPYVHLVSYAERRGITPDQGSILLMILGASTAVGRLLFGKIVQLGFLNRVHMHQMSMVITGTLSMLLPVITTFGGLVTYVILIGLVDGCFVVLLPMLTYSLMAGEDTTIAWGFLVGTCSITFTIGPPIAGALFDSLGSYNVAFHCAGIPVVAGAVILFFIPWAQRTSQSNNVMIVISQECVGEGEGYEEEGDFTELQPGASSSTETVIFTPAQKGGKKRKAKPSISTETAQRAQHADVPDYIYYRRRFLPYSRYSSEANDVLEALHKNSHILSEMLGQGSSQDRDRLDVGAPPPGWQCQPRRSYIDNLRPQEIPGPHRGNVLNIMSVPAGLAVMPSEIQQQFVQQFARRENVSNAPSTGNSSRYPSRQVSNTSYNVICPTVSELYQTTVARQSRGTSPPQSPSSSYDNIDDYIGSIMGHEQNKISDTVVESTGHAVPHILDTENDIIPTARLPSSELSYQHGQAPVSATGISNIPGNRVQVIDGKLVVIPDNQGQFQIPILQPTQNVQTNIQPRGTNPVTTDELNHVSSSNSPYTSPYSVVVCPVSPTGPGCSEEVQITVPQTRVSSHTPPLPTVPEEETTSQVPSTSGTNRRQANQSTSPEAPQVDDVFQHLFDN